MPRFVVAPDSFKGSLTSLQAGTIIAKAIRDHFPHDEITVVPMADGGEGTIEALVTATSGQLLQLRAVGPLGEETMSEVGIIHNDTVVIETARIAGLTMVPEQLRNPYNTTSRGIGQLLVQALDRGYRKFVIGLGGSATNDGGIGMLSELGALILDSDGNRLEGFGRDLERIASIDLSGLDTRLNECELLAASDVTNQLCGPEGASVVFGPQKGADKEQIMRLDAALLRYAQLMEAHSSRPSLHTSAGAGAAGGIGFALLSIGFTIISGAELIDQISGLQSKIAHADWVITGEGRTDGQSMYGKLPVHVAKLAEQYGTKAILISGSLGDGYHSLQKLFAGCFAIVNEPANLQTCMTRAPYLLECCANNVMRFLSQAMQTK